MLNDPGNKKKNTSFYERQAKLCEDFLWEERLNRDFLDDEPSDNYDDNDGGFDPGIG